MTIRPRRGGYQVIVYAGIDPVTGRQRQIARQVKGKREAERLEARLRAEVADGRHRGTSARTVGELLDVYLGWPETSGKPLSFATLNDYRTIVETKLKSAVGKLRLPSSTRSSWTASTASCAAGAATTVRHSAPAGSGRSTPCCPAPWAWPPATGGSASKRCVPTRSGADRRWGSGTTPWPQSIRWPRYCAAARSASLTLTHRMRMGSRYLWRASI
jgi:hypothetical protein